MKCTATVTSGVIVLFLFLLRYNTKLTYFSVHPDVRLTNTIKVCGLIVSFVITINIQVQWTHEKRFHMTK